MCRKPQNSSINTAFDDGDRTKGEPKLFWPIYKYSDCGDNEIVEEDRDEFPEIKYIVASFSVAKYWAKNDDTINVKREGEFWKALLQSEEAYIVDKRFSPKEFRQILLMLSDGDDMRLKKMYILCQNEYSAVRRMYEKRDEIVDGKTIPVDIIVCDMNIGKGAPLETHDRFALLDNEIWHFGGTVGGVNAHLTAYSRGWIDSNKVFRQYLNEIVDKRISG